MRDQGLPEVLNYLELLTQKAILRSQTLPAVKINFDSVGAMSRQEAIIAIESLLALNGIAITPVGERFLKAAPIAEVAKQVPQFLTGSTLAMQASQQFYTKYFKLEYLDALNEGQPIVQGLLSVAGKQEGNPVIFPKSNSILVTDMLINLQRIEEVLRHSDVPQGGVTQLTFFQLKHVKAEDLKRRLTTLIGNKDSSIAAAFSHNTTIEADERTNQLIVATHASNLSLLRQLVDGLDSDVEPQTTSEVYYIKHGEAVNIQTLLDSVISGQQQVRDQANSAQTAGMNAQAAQGGAAQGNPAAEVVAAIANAQAGINATLSDARALRFSNYITVTADERANAIVAYGTRTDLEQIGKLIDKIDILLAQVNIQVIIAEVTLSDGVANGIEQLSIGYNADQTWSLGTSGARYTGGDSPFTFNGTLDPKTFQLVINNAKTNSNFRMLSSPVIVTTHNQEGRVDVTESRPIITGTSTQLLENPVTSSTVTYRDIGIKLTVKPLIGNNGIIQMQILQEVENITGFEAVNGNQQPVIARRMAESYVSVRSGEVVVLAGLQESSLTENDNRLWLIGEIPLLGDLLNGRGKVVKRRELMIFIQPFVMTTSEEIAQMTEQAIDNLDNASDVRTFLETRDASSVTIEQARAMAEESPEANRPVTRPRRGSGR